MVIITPINGPLWILSGACFTFVAVLADILLIRFFLILAFSFLLLWGAVGSPQGIWSWTRDGYLNLSMVLYCVIPLAFHCIAFCKLLYAERPIRFDDKENDEAVWRLFHRRSGMGRLEMKTSLSRSRKLTVKKGQTVWDSRAEGGGDIFLIVEGVVHCKAIFEDKVASEFDAYSGEIFDYKSANILGVCVKFFNDYFVAEARTDVVLYRWTGNDLNYLAAHSPALSAYWKNFITFSIANSMSRKVLERQLGKNSATDSYGNVEDERFFKGARSRDFSPLLPSELPETHYETTRDWIKSLLTIEAVLSFFRFVRRSVSFPEPEGIRHRSLPSAGIIARKRLLSLYVSTAKSVSIDVQDSAVESSQTKTDIAQASKTQMDDTCTLPPPLQDVEIVATHCSNISPKTKEPGQEIHLQQSPKMPTMEAPRVRNGQERNDGNEDVVAIHCSNISPKTKGPGEEVHLKRSQKMPTLEAPKLRNMDKRNDESTIRYRPDNTRAFSVPILAAVEKSKGELGCSDTPKAKSVRDLAYQTPGVGKVTVGASCVSRRHSLGFMTNDADNLPPLRSARVVVELGEDDGDNEEISDCFTYGALSG